MFGFLLQIQKDAPPKSWILIGGTSVEDLLFFFRKDASPKRSLN
jgi:hypothetical protein